MSIDRVIRTALHEAVDRVVDVVAEVANGVMEAYAPAPKPPVTKMCKHCGLALPEDAE